MSSIIRFGYFEDGEEKNVEIEVEIPDTSDFELNPVYRDKDGRRFMVTFDHDKLQPIYHYLDGLEVEMKKPWISGVWKERIGEVLCLLAGCLVVYLFLKYFNK